MRSKPVSQTSPKPGDAPDPAAAPEDAASLPRASARRLPADKPRTGRADGEPDGKDGKDARDARVEIELEVSRQRSIGWTIVGLVVGSLMIWKLGTVGVWGGVAMVATGVYHAWLLAQSLRHPPGTIIVTATEVILPRGLSLPRPVRVKPEEVTAVYFLRRSVPWNHVSPVLIVELGATAMAFPHNWFATEADQRRVVHALLHRKPGATLAADSDPAG
jgi:hypothetical protein